ncbi:WD40-repeat-containing domain protein, partial [Immersiella caudata]
PDSTLLASGSMDETVAIWDALTGSLLKRINNQSSGVNTVAFSPDGSLIATGAVDRMVRLWNVHSKSKKLHAMLDGHLCCINPVRFSPDGKHIVSGSDDMTVKLW